MEYVATPTTIRIDEILGNKASLSPHNYNRVLVDANRSMLVRDFLSSEPTKGDEVGSSSYITESHKYFIRTKALQPDSLLLDLNNDSIIPILPSKFIDQNLQKNDIIISKDSNIGEVVILDQDYSDYMLSNGLYKLPVDKNEYYLLAFIKHPFFKTQLNFLVSKGATIRHAKTLFLDCKIPLPKHSPDQNIYKVEELTKEVIEAETAIRKNEAIIFELINGELNLGRIKDYHYSLPSIKDIGASARIDAGFYCEDYKSKQWLIESYKNGAGTLKDWGYDVGRGQNLQVSAIGKSIYSSQKHDLFYTLVRPTNFSNYGTVRRYEYLGNKNKLDTIQPGDIVFSAEGSIGKCVMFVDPGDKVITNIHGIVLNKTDHNKQESAYVCSFLRYLRKVGILDYISVGGQGGSLAVTYLPEVKIPRFPIDVQTSISKLYHNPGVSAREEMGILELDSKLKETRLELNELLSRIISGQV